MDDVGTYSEKQNLLKIRNVRAINFYYNYYRTFLDYCRRKNWVEFEDHEDHENYYEGWIGNYKIKAGFDFIKIYEKKGFFRFSKFISCIRSYHNWSPVNPVCGDISKGMIIIKELAKYIDYEYSEKKYNLQKVQKTIDEMEAVIKL